MPPFCVDKRPVMSSICGTWVDSDSDQLVLPAVVILRPLVVLIGFSSFLAFIITKIGWILSILFPHYFIEWIRFEIQQCRELKEGIYLVVAESVEVEDDTLQVHDQDVGGLWEKDAFADFNLFVAFLAVEVTDCLSFNQLLEAFTHGLDVLHCEG